MAWAALPALLSHWRYRPLQLATLVLGIALATALWSGVQAINAEARASYGRAAAVLEQKDFAQLIARDGGLIPVSQYVALRRAGWKASPVIEGEHRFGQTRVKLVGIDPLTMPSQDMKIASSEPDLSAFLGGGGQMIVSPSTAKRLSEGGSEVSVKIDPGLPDGAAFVDIALADRLLTRGGLISKIVVAPDQRPDIQRLEDVTPGLVLRVGGERPDVERLTDSFHLNLTAFGFLAFVVGLFIVYSATGLSFEQRRGTIRTLRSLGVSIRSLTAMLLVEIAFFALVSGILGIILGYLIASALLPDVASALSGLYGASVPGTLSLLPEWWLAGMGMALLGVAVSSAQSLWQLWTMPILASAQQRAWARSSAAGLAVQAAAGLAFAAVAAALAIYGSGLLSGFAVLGGLLLGAALIVPGLLAVCMTLGRRLSKGAIAVWFWADTRQQLPGLSLALMALLLALSANIGVGTMVSSFRHTFIGWLDQRLAAEVYVTARDENEAARLRAWLPPHTRSVLPIWNVDGEVAGQDVQIYGVADDPTYRDHWPLISGTAEVWDEIASGRGAIVNEQLWRAGKAAPGGEIALRGGWRVRVVGVSSDYGNPKGQVIVGVDALVKHYPDVPKLRYGLRIDPADVLDFRRKLVADLDVPDSNIVDQASLKSQSTLVFEQTFAVTGALNVLTLAVAGFAMFSSLLTLSSRRLPQLAPVWAMGLRRRDLALLEVARTVALWFATFLASIPVGLTLAWVLLAIVNVEAFGWRLPLFLFPEDWLKLGVIALIAAIVSVAIPVRRLAMTSPADLIRVFANER